MSKQPADITEQKQRRKLVKTLAGACGTAVIAKTLPEQWTSPLIQSVSLPVHAQLTGVSGDFGDEGFFGTIVQSSTSHILPLDLVVPKAYAGGINPGGFPLNICFRVENGQVTLLNIIFEQDSNALLLATGLPRSLNETITLDVSKSGILLSGEVDFTGINGNLSGVVTLEDTDNAVAEFAFSAGNSKCAEAGP